MLTEEFVAKAMELADEYAHLNAVAESEDFTNNADLTQAEQAAEAARDALEDHLHTYGVREGGNG